MPGKKKILITGASGYIGSRLCHFLYTRGYYIIACTSSEPSSSSKLLNCISKLIIGDIRDKKTVQEIANSQAHTIIHLVSLNHWVSEDDVNISFDVNVKPIANILSASLALNKHLKQFFYMSTVQVYGKILRGDISTHQKMNPTNIYGLTHQIGEHICNYYNDNTKLNCYNLRLSNSYGHPFGSSLKCWDLVVNNLVKSAFETKKIILHTDGLSQKDFIHFSEIGASLIQLMNGAEIEGNTINLVSGKTQSLLSIAEQVQKVYSIKYSREIPIYINENELYDSGAKNMFSPEFRFLKSITLKSDTEKAGGLLIHIREIFDYLEERSLNTSN